MDMMTGITPQAHPIGHGAATSIVGEDGQLRAQLLRLRDQVILGQHPNFKLSAGALQKLRAGMLSDANGNGDTAGSGSGAGISAFAANRQKSAQTSTLPGLYDQTVNGAAAHSQNGKATASAAFNPIFLEKSDSLVRAEGQLKRQRIERDLQIQAEQRKHSHRGQDSGADGPAAMDIDQVLHTALSSVPHVSTFRPSPDGAHSSVFDENDYYSSLVESEWSSNAGSRRGSNDRAVGGFTADYERLDGSAQTLQPAAELQKSTVHGSPRLTRSQARANVYANGDSDDAYEVTNDDDGEDEEDEYSPPEAGAIDSSRPPAPAGDHFTSLDEDDSSDYEPGEISQDSNHASPHYNLRPQPPPHQSPTVPVIRNHLTHIAAPQPNRVSPLAMAKGPNVELELVNGRPEMVKKPKVAPQSRASTASPPSNAAASQKQKRRNSKKQKRKREMESSNAEAPRSGKKRRAREAAAQSSPASSSRVKREPMTPPAFPQNTPKYLPEPPESQYRPVAGTHTAANELPHTSHRHSNIPLGSPALVTSQPLPTYRPPQRDSQDLRRVASLRHAEQRSPPHQRTYSPVGPYRTVALDDGQPSAPHSQGLFTVGAQYEGHGHARGEVPYGHQQQPPSPPRYREVTDPYVQRESSPAFMPPPRRIVVDQYGNKYYAADPTPAPAPAPPQSARASVAPVMRMAPPTELAYERSQSRMAYSQAPPPAQYYDYADDRSAAPTSHRQREYNTRPTDSVRYAEAPTSPVFTSTQAYQPMAPPPPPPRTRDATAPPYQPLPRSYSVRPEEQPLEYSHHRQRQATVAPGPYFNNQEMPPPPPNRAVSVMPGAEYGAAGLQQQSSRQYAQSQPQPQPQPGMRYMFVDQNGNEVFPTQVRQLYQ